MVRWLMLSILGLILLGVGGCATTDDDPNRVSTIPWNRPERWEGQGPLGGMINQSR